MSKQQVSQAGTPRKLVLVLVCFSGQLLLGEAQFLPAQSHLGRLVQSITSPLVLGAPGFVREPMDSLAEAAAGSVSGYSGERPSSDHYQEPKSAYLPEASRHQSTGAGYYYAGGAGLAQAMQSAPSQERGIPHHYYQRHYQNQNQQDQSSQPQEANYASEEEQQQRQQQHQQQQQQQQQQQYFQQQRPYQPQASYQQEDEAVQAPVRGQQARQQMTGRARDQVGASPSNQARRQQRRQQQGSHQRPEQQQPEYQMGAYLGPSIDDKDIQGAFNSANDERDDDEGPAAAPFDGQLQGARSKAASSAYRSNSSPSGEHEGASVGAGQDGFGYNDNDSFGYGPSGADSSSAGAPSGPVGFGAGAGGPLDDDSSDADEDEPSGHAPARPNRPRARGALSRAASQSHQRDSQSGQHYLHQQQQEQPQPQPQQQVGRSLRGRQNQVRGPTRQQQQQQQSEEEADQERALGGQRETGGRNQGGLMAAANGYAPFGYANGPVDLTGLVAGGLGNGFQVYDAGAANYNPYAGPQQAQQANRMRSASNAYDGFDNPNDGFAAKGSDMDDNDADDD